MNKLAERIRDARRPGGRRIGFGIADAGKATSRGLLIAARGAGAEGIDIALLSDPAAIGSVDGEVVVGVQASPLTAVAAEAAENAGAAFVAYDPDHADAEALLREKLDYALQLPDRAVEDSELRAVSTLRPALVIGPPVSEPLPVAKLIDLRRLSLTLAAPLAVAIPADAGRDLLEVLRDAGVVVLILDSPSAEQVAALRTRIDELPLSPRRRDDETAPVVTGVRAESAAIEDDDFDED